MPLVDWESLKQFRMPARVSAKYMYVDSLQLHWPATVPLAPNRLNRESIESAAEPAPRIRIAVASCLPEEGQSSEFLSVTCHSLAADRLTIIISEYQKISAQLRNELFENERQERDEISNDQQPKMDLNPSSYVI